MSVLKKNIYINYGVQVFNTGVNFAYSLVIVRQLGAFSYGEYSVFFNSIAFSVLLFGFNLPSVLVFFVANKKIDAGKLLYSSLLVTFFASICLLLLLYASGYLKFAIHIFPGGNNKPLWIFFFSVTFFLLQINQLLQAFLNAHKIFIPIAVFSSICNAVFVLFWVAVSFNVINIGVNIFDAIWWAGIFINTITAIYAVYLVKKEIVINHFWKIISIAELRLLAGFAIVVYICNTLQFLNYKMDIWFVNYYDLKEEVGIYSLALSLSQLVWVLPNAISAILLNYFRVNKKKYSVLTAVNYAGISFYASICIAAILSLIYYFAIPYFYGPQFSNTFTLCLVLFIGVIPFSLSIVIANLNSGIGFVRINLYATIFTFALGCILDIIMIPKYGIQGAAIAKAIVYIAGLVFQIIAGRVLYQFPWQAMFRLPDWRRITKLN